MCISGGGGGYTPFKIVLSVLSVSSFLVQVSVQSADAQLLAAVSPSTMGEDLSEEGTENRCER